MTLTRLDDIIKLAGRRDARQPRSNGYFVLERPGYALGERLRVTYRVRGTARAGRDYRRLDGVATFRPGARTTREVVRVINRKGTQGPKVVKVRLTRGTGYTVGRPGATRVVIRDARTR
ncbi:hypothetical protein [Nocardioides euryhalodurans]|uniref:Calx-beta domain-containing protein n=1 Tax=Nocardioides euryhalodurans TaxID=2518370 RepID=A0A4P7GHH6_9ACTN|nr:hypothetical protein [Nocardioides euryhalodurans]QBR91119.1 hypothetical protein EXE57_01675 [Nocardioides euryhalodurans]